MKEHYDYYEFGNEIDFLVMKHMKEQAEWLRSAKNLFDKDWQDTQRFIDLLPEEK